MFCTVAHGWNVDYSAHNLLDHSVSTASAWKAWTIRWLGVGHAVGCLRARTGGTFVLFGCLRLPAPVNSPRYGVGWRVAGRCLRTTQWTRASVAKFLRAHGGCLGTRNR